MTLKNFLNIKSKKVYLPSSEQQYWTTKEGEKILISDLKDSHLLNIQRSLANRILVYAVISNEVKKRGLIPLGLKVSKAPNIQSILDMWEQDMQHCPLEDFH